MFTKFSISVVKCEKEKVHFDEQTQKALWLGHAGISKCYP